jgi:hypothetical protein
MLQNFLQIPNLTLITCLKFSARFLLFNGFEVFGSFSIIQRFLEYVRLEDS